MSIKLAGLHFTYNGEFNKFSPLSQEIDEEWGGGQLQYVVKRARRCLVGRTDSQVTHIAEWCDWLVSEAVKAKRIIGVNRDGTEEPFTAESGFAVDDLSVVYFVCEFIRDFVREADDGKLDLGFLDEDGNSIEGIDAVLPSDVLATYALIQCAKAAEFDHSDWIVYFGVMHAMVAAECVAAAEIEQHMDRRHAESFKEKLSDVTRRAANAKWKVLDAARDRAREIYSSREWPSRAEAIKQMKEEIMDIARRSGRPLAPSNAANTIDGWLRVVEQKK